MQTGLLSCFLRLSKDRYSSSISLFTGKLLLKMEICPASIFEISMMSVMICRSCLLLELMISINVSFLSSEKFLFFSRFANPRIAFMGVRISWLMLARKEDFNLSLSSAFSLALTSSSFIIRRISFCSLSFLLYALISSSACFRSVISRDMPETPMTSSDSLKMGAL